MTDSRDVSPQSVLDAVNGGIVALDRSEHIVLWNDWMKAASGIAAADALGRSLAEVFPGADLNRLLAAIKTALTSNAATLITHALNPHLLPLRSRSRQPLLHDTTISPVGEREITGCVVFITDVTTSTRRDRYLRDQQNARYDAVVASAPDVIITVDEEGIVQFANPAATRQFGASHPELVGADAAQLFQPQDEWTKLWRGAVEGTPASRPRELLAARNSGEVRYFEATASAWKSGGQLFATVILRDVTERRLVNEALRASEAEARDAAAALAELNRTLEERVQLRTSQLMKAEEALRHSQKMEAIGNLTGGIAHDFNNLLHVISGNLHLLKRDVLGNGPAERRVQSALDGVSRSAKLSSQLLAFARRQPLAPKVINLGRFIREMEDILRKAVGEGVTIEMIIGAGLWNTLIDPGNVENALLNLAINARDAMDGQGRLTIEAGNASLDSAYVEAHGEVTGGQYVMIAVTDTGAGMPPEIIEQAFEPFFTTKPEGRGTGLGLSMVYGFVKQSGGHIKISSEIGQGTTVKVYLPRSMRSEDRLEDVESFPAVGGSEVVLVAEDDASVRETVAAMLGDLGYRVLQAKDAESALSIIESGMPIDLLLTDVVMPGALRSTELARKARERMPNLAVLFTSGYTQGSVVHSGQLDESLDLLSKPYSRETLARKLRHTLVKTAQRKAPLVPGTYLPPAPRARATTARRVLVCDFDADIRSTTVDMLTAMGHQAMPAGDARTALSILTRNPIDVLLADTALPDMSGSVLAEYAKSRFPSLGVILAAGSAAGTSTVSQLPAQVLDKPFTFDQLAAAIAGTADGAGK